MIKSQTKLRYKLNLGFIVQKVAGKTAIYSGEESLLYTLNETGSYIFSGLKLGWPKEKIIEGLTKTYAISNEQATNDLEAFETILIKKKILISVNE